MTGSLGINTNITQTQAPGFVVGSTGALTFTGNLGTASDFSIQSSDFNLNNNVVFTKSQSADGESIFTQFTAYDSLGSEVVVQLTAYLESLGTEESQFRILFESPNQRLDPANLPTGFADQFDRSVGTGTLTFNALGQLDSVTATT